MHQANREPSNEAENREQRAESREPTNAHALEAEVRLYDRLFAKPDPFDTEEGEDYTDHINPNSLEISTCMIEPTVQGTAPGTRYQFERKGYFCVDPDATDDRLVFNRTITLRDSWAKIEKAMRQGQKK